MSEEIYSVRPHMVFHSRPHFTVAANSAEEAERKFKRYLEETDFENLQPLYKKAFNNLHEEMQGGYSAQLAGDIQVEAWGHISDFNYEPDIN